MSWSYGRHCRDHADLPCDCEYHMKYDVWELTDDTRGVIGIVERFHEGASYYGNTAYGRTGAMDDRLKCQAKVEEMLVTGKDRLGRPN